MPINKIVTILKRDGYAFSTKRALAWLIGHSPLALKLSFPYYKNYRLVFAPSMLTYILFAGKTVRNDDITVLEEFIHAGDTVIDVGAHIGSMTIVAAACTGATGKVLAFEPVPKFATIMQANVAQNNLGKIISVFPFAVGANTQNIFINDNVKDDTTNHVATSGTEVKQVTLDEHTNTIEAVALLKIDVEGYEIEVLRGAPETLKKTRVIFIEFYTRNLEKLGYNPEEILDILNEHFNLYTQDTDSSTSFSYQPNQAYEINLIGIKK